MPARGFALLAVVSIAAVLLIVVCDLVFDCGCRSLWNGAAADCNIHRAEPPHCPWCAYPAAGAAALVASTIAQAALLFGPLGGLGLLARSLLALAAFPVASGAAGILAGLLLGYWS